MTDDDTVRPCIGAELLDEIDDVVSDEFRLSLEHYSVEQRLQALLDMYHEERNKNVEKRLSRR
jgi:hypothetical protein